ncbi:MAG: hypothetical protein R3D25_11170 [Geminicoccaceae bacterium]
MTRIATRLAALGLAALLCVAGPAPTRAADSLVSDEWEFQLTPYFWALAMEGNTKVKGIKGEPDVSFSDIWDNLDFALMLEGEVRKGRIGMYANAIYADLSDTQGVAGFDIKAEATTVWAGLGGFYRLGPWTVLPGAGALAPEVVVDPYAGIRYTYLDTTLRVRNGGPQASQDKDWVDPIVGVRTIWQIGPNWSVTALGDIGGFGAGSDFTWQAAGMVGYRFGLFGDDNARLLAGYRALYQDYSSGNGNNEFKWDMTLHGPIVGLAISF